MTPRKRTEEAGEAVPPGDARQAGFPEPRPALEERIERALGGTLADATLMSTDGLWVTFLAREPCCGARLMLNVRTRRPLGERAVRDLSGAAERNRDVRHPAVLSVRRWGLTDDLVWVTTRARRGRLMRLRFGSDPSAAVARALEFLRRVARPLDAVHRDGLVHGALEASSFHCDVEGRIRIRNLGVDVPVLLALADHGVETDVAACAAPEVLAGASPRPESDQYALAAIVLGGMTGRTPGDDGVAWDTVPRALRGVLRRALRREPTERFATVLEMWQAIDPEAASTRERPGRAHDQGGRTVPGSVGAFEEPEPAANAPPSGRSSGRMLGGVRRRTRVRSGSSSPWARTLAAAAVLLLFVGSLEWVGDWRQLASLALLAPDEDTTAVPAAATTDPDVPAATGIVGSVGDTADPGQSPYPAVGASTDGTLGAPLPLPETAEAMSSTSSVSDDVGADPSPLTTERPASTWTEEASFEPRTPGILSLHSYPWGEVYLDGDYVGNTPLLDFRVSAGEHELRIERAGYEAHVETITVVPGETVRRTGIVLGGERR